MLHDLLVNERTAIVTDCEDRVLKFGGSLTRNVPSHGWAVFYDELIGLLIDGNAQHFVAESRISSKLALQHVKGHVKLGFTIGDVIESYGILSDSINTISRQIQYPIEASEYTELNQLFRGAISEAVTEHEKSTLEEKEKQEVERLGALAHELRNGLQAAMAAFDMIESGAVGPNSNTSLGLQQSLQRMASLIDTALTEVRMRVEPEVRLGSVNILEVLNEVAGTAGYLARKRNIHLRIKGFAIIHVLADRQLLVSALSNLVQNALKYTKHGTAVEITTRQVGILAFIDVQDQCGGLPAGMHELLKPFTQHSDDHSGLGLGLTIAKRAIERCTGELLVRDMPGEGCVFTIQLNTVATKGEYEWP